MPSFLVNPHFLVFVFNSLAPFSTANHILVEILCLWVPMPTYPPDFLWPLSGPFHQFSSVQSFSRVRLFVTPRTTAGQASLSITNSRSLLKLMSIFQIGDDI